RQCSRRLRGGRRFPPWLQGHNRHGARHSGSDHDHDCADDGVDRQPLADRRDGYRRQPGTKGAGRRRRLGFGCGHHRDRAGQQREGHAGATSFTQSLRIEGGNLVNQWTPPDNYGLCTAATVASTSTNPLCVGQSVGTLVHDNPLLRAGAFRNGSSSIIDWGARGGGQNYGYNLSYGQDKENGVLPNNNYNRYSIRSNFNYVPNAQLTIDAGLGLTQSDARLPDNDNNTIGWLGGALLGNPSTRTTLPGAQYDGWYGFNRHYNAINSVDHDLLSHRVITSLTANYLPAPWFPNRFTLGMDFLQ